MVSGSCQLAPRWDEPSGSEITGKKLHSEYRFPFLSQFNQPVLI